MDKYKYISLDIRSKISSGEYAQGDRLPPIPQLCAMYGVSKITIKRAMDDLEHLGIVSRRRGSGTYVKGLVNETGMLRVQEILGQMEGFVAEAEAYGATVTSDVHDFSVIRATSDIAEALAIEPGEFVYHVYRTRRVNSRPQIIERSYLPLSLVPGLREAHVHGSLYRYVEDELGLTIASAHRTIYAVNPSEQEAAWLGIPLDSPLLSIWQIGFLDDGRPFEQSTILHTVGHTFHTMSSR